MNRYFVFILFFSNLLLSAFNHQGQLWIDYNSHNSLTSPIGYIPQFNIEYKNFDFEYSNKIIFENSNSEYYNQDYRYWIRYNNYKVDLI